MSTRETRRDDVESKRARERVLRNERVREREREREETRGLQKHGSIYTSRSRAASICTESESAKATKSGAQRERRKIERGAFRNTPLCAKCDRPARDRFAHL